MANQALQSPGIAPASVTEMKARSANGFGPRLAAFRKAKGLTQGQLGATVGVSYRVIAYYETEGGQPPGALLPALAKTLGVSVDELLAVKPTRTPVGAKSIRLMHRLQRIEQLNTADQRALLKIVDAFLETRLD